MAKAKQTKKVVRRTIKRRVTSFTTKYRRHDRKWMLMNINAIFFQPTVSKAFPEYNLEHNPPKMYKPDTRPATVAVEPNDIAYSVTVDIKAYITSAEKSKAPNTKKKSLVKILSSLFWIFINYIYVPKN